MKEKTLNFPVYPVGRALSNLHIGFEVPEDISALSIKAGKYNLQRLFDHHIFECLWNDQFTPDENNFINFDWYHRANAYRHLPGSWVKARMS